MTPMRGTPPSVARKQAAQFDKRQQDMLRNQEIARTTAYIGEKPPPEIAAIQERMKAEQRAVAQPPQLQRAVAQPPQLPPQFQDAYNAQQQFQQQEMAAMQPYQQRMEAALNANPAYQRLQQLEQRQLGPNPNPQQLQQLQRLRAQIDGDPAFNEARQAAQQASLGFQQQYAQPFQQKYGQQLAQLQQYDRLQNMPPPQRPYGGQGNDMKGTSPTGPDRYGKTAADLAAEYRNSVVPPGYEFANQRPMPQIMGGSANKMGSVPGMLGVAPAVMPRGGLGSMPANPTGPRTMGGLGSRPTNPTMSGTPKTGLQGIGAALGSKLGMKPTGGPMPAQQTPQAGKPMAKPPGAPMQPQKMMKKGGAVKAPAKKMASGGKVSSASKRGDGIASKGKTNCKMY